MKQYTKNIPKTKLKTILIQLFWIYVKVSEKTFGIKVVIKIIMIFLIQKFINEHHCEHVHETFCENVYGFIKKTKQLRNVCEKLL